MNISDLLNLYTQGQQGGGQRSANNNEQRGLSSNLMGDYDSQPKYGPQGGANPWQEQLWSQLFQQQDIQRKQPETKGGGK